MVLCPANKVIWIPFILNKLWETIATTFPIKIKIFICPSFQSLLKVKKNAIRHSGKEKEMYKAIEKFPLTWDHMESLQLYQPWNTHFSHKNTGKDHKVRMEDSAKNMHINVGKLRAKVIPWKTEWQLVIVYASDWLCFISQSQTAAHGKSNSILPYFWLGLGWQLSHYKNANKAV